MKLIYLSPSISMTRDLPKIFEKFSNIVADVKLVIELHSSKAKRAVNKNIIENAE